MAKKEQEKVFASPAVPMGYCQLQTQVAGHKFDANNAAAVGLLQDAGEGLVFKPLGKPECAMRELNFYESLAAAISAKQADAGASPPVSNNLNGTGDSDWTTEQSLLAAFAAHVPRYYGQLKLVVNQREHTFIKLEDLTHGMAKPCIMDVKIGRRTWDPLASAEKRAYEEGKYFRCKQALGLCLPGFQVYQPDEQQPEQTVFIRKSRDFGRSLDVISFIKALDLFFNKECSSSKVLLREVLIQLRSIRTWFKRQRLLHFYASSLLICYDYEQLQRLAKVSHNSNSKSNKKGCNQAVSNPAQTTPPNEWIRVRCIDFAHTFKAEDGQPDENYLFGLESLIGIVQDMLKAALC